jgi:hypothetical protein
LALGSFWPGDVLTVLIRGRFNLPGTSTEHTSNELNAIYLNARSLKAFVPFNDDSSAKVCKITLLQELVHSYPAYRLSEGEVQPATITPCFRFSPAEPPAKFPLAS